MLRMPRFEYAAPSTVKEAMGILSREGARAVLVAGGTEVYPRILRRQQEPGLVVSLGRIAERKGIRGNEVDGVRIGPNTTIEEVAADSTLRLHYPALAQAAAMVASPQIRNVGTIGGNLLQDTRCIFYDESHWWRRGLGPCLKLGGDICHLAGGSHRCWAVSASDVAPAAVALGARLTLTGKGGTRTTSVDGLYRDDGDRHLAMSGSEIVTSIALPPARKLRSIYLKLRRRGAIDFPMLGVAAAARVDSRGICTRAWVVLGGVASRPVKVPGIEKLLRGKVLSPALIERAADDAYATARPMDNADLTLVYRNWMVREYVKRALAELAS